jgi:hypothetical protein
MSEEASRFVELTGCASAGLKMSSVEWRGQVVERGFRYRRIAIPDERVPQHSDTDLQTAIE